MRPLSIMGARFTFMAAAIVLLVLVLGTVVFMPSVRGTSLL